MKHNRRNLSILLAVLLIVGLYLMHNQAIMPLVMKAVHTPVFTGDPKLGGQSIAVRDDRTAMASIHCKTFIRQQIPLSRSTTFPKNDYTAWDIGFGRYLIRSYVDIETPDGASQRKNFVCKLRFTGNDENNLRNWTFMGADMSPGSPSGS